MTPLRDRVLGALALQPMTVMQLAMCLDLTRQQVHQALRRSAVVRIGTVRSSRRPAVVYGCMNAFCHTQNENPRYARTTEEAC